MPRKKSTESEPAPDEASGATKKARKKGAREPVSIPSVTEPAETFVEGRARRKRQVLTVSEKPAPEGPDSESAAPAADPPRSRRRTQRKPAEVPDSTRGDDLEGALPKLSWRAPASPPQASEPAPNGTGAQLSPRRSPLRRRRDRVDVEVSAAAAISEPSPPTAKPERPAKARRPEAKPSRTEARRAQRPATPPAPAFEFVHDTVEAPPDAPRVVLLNGRPTIVRDNRAFPQIMFFGSSPDEKRAATVFEEIKLASENGVHVFSHLLDLVAEPSGVRDATALAAYLIRRTMEVDASAQVILRVVIGSPPNWDRIYPRAKYISESGGLAEPSLCDDTFWSVVENCLRDLIAGLMSLGLGPHLLGVHLERGEWFFADRAGYDTSPAALDRFRDWLRTRYRDDVVALRAAWFDGQVQFQTVPLPEYGGGVRAGEEFVRTGRKARRWVDYHLFLSDVTVQRIGKLAYVVKQASEGRLLVGASYGYTFEWSHPGSGHLSLGKLLRTRAIDFIGGPPSYRNREPGSSAAFPGPVDSFALNGKLYISEEDFKTPISEGREPDDFNPVMRTPQALDSVHWRGAGAALAHAYGVCWMDSWGNGWLNTPEIWKRAGEIRACFTHALSAPAGDPDVAVFIDERSLSYLVDQHAFQLLVQNVRESILRSGLNAGFYLLSDLAHRERFPNCKLYVFMNAWDIRPEVRSAIKSRLHRDEKVLFWLYAAGLFDAGRESLERVREATGIALRPQPFGSKPGTALLNRRHPLCEALAEGGLQAGVELVPSYFAIPEDGTVLGEYIQTGLPSFVMREFRNEGDDERTWTSVFLGEPVVNPALFRTLGQMAGAHVWNYNEDVVHVRPPFLTVHCTGAGPRAITLPDKWSAYNVLAKRFEATDATHLHFQATDGATMVFLVGLKQEIEWILSRSPDDVLTLSEIPEQPDNTLHLGSILFDVPIMKLGEWVEESWSDELAEDFLLRPGELEPEPVEVAETEEKLSQRAPASRRRRRSSRGGNGKPGSEETGEDLLVNYVFRKRE